jgi:hypothetical protein
VLAPDGVYLANVIDNPTRGEFMRAYVHTLATVFPYRYVLAGPGGGDLRYLATYVVAASSAPLDVASLDDSSGGIHVIPEARVAAWLADGRPLVLTDDYAPVDNLMAPIFAERGY